MGNSGSSNGGDARSSRAKSGKKKKRGIPKKGLGIEDFDYPAGFVANIGVGGFGRVMAMVRKDDPTRRFAIKCLEKQKVVRREQVPNCINELNILIRMDHHPYLVNLFYAFQDRFMLYMCTDLMLGGTLQRAMRKGPDGCLAIQPERVCRFAAELTLALQFLHSQNVVHRDIKPDNILLDVNDHLHVTDFNVSLYVEPGNEETQKHEDGWGTRGYRAPEVYLRTGRGFIFACDWWSAGAVLFELLTGAVPYSKKNDEEPSSELLMRMNRECAEFGKIKDEMARDFCEKLLRFDPECRIGCQHGCNSEVMVMTHPYFGGMDWDELERYTNPNEIDSRGEGAKTTTADSAAIDSLAGKQTDLSTHSAPVEPSLTNGKNSKGGLANIHDYAGNFDAALDEKHRLRVLQRNMGALGFGGMDDSDDSSDEDYMPLTDEQQALFKDWQFDVDFKLEQQARPRFTLLQTVSSLAPEQIKNWILQSSEQSLRALCGEMKAYREQAMKENYDHVLAAMELERLRSENLRLTRELAEARKAEAAALGASLAGSAEGISKGDEKRAGRPADDLSELERNILEMKAVRRQSRRQSRERCASLDNQQSSQSLRQLDTANLDRATDEDEVELFSAATDKRNAACKKAENTPPQSPGPLSSATPIAVAQDGVPQRKGDPDLSRFQSGASDDAKPFSLYKVTSEEE